MSYKRQWIALALGAIIIFITGAYWGKWVGKEAPLVNTSASTARGNITAGAIGSVVPLDRSNAVRPNDSKKSAAITPAEEEIMRKLRDAMLLPKESRTQPLLQALEGTTKLALSKNLLDELRRIVDEGEIESSHYVLSLMEQREEKSSVDLLLHAAAHQNADVADRALFALEAVAGTVFKSQQEAAAWAATWRVDSERHKLFAPINQPSADAAEESQPRIPGPRSYEPKPHTRKPD